jgi:hypothetical protein
VNGAPETPGASQIKIRLIQSDLILARVSRSDLESCIKPLLQLALFPSPYAIIWSLKQHSFNISTE